MRPALLALLVVLLSAAPAEAKVFFKDMGGRTVRWDARVSSTISGCPGNESCRQAVEGAPVYLRSIAGGAIRRIGTVDADGTISFRVPHVRAGRYRLLVRVPADSTQRLIRASSAFRVLRG